MIECLLVILVVVLVTQPTTVAGVKHSSASMCDSLCVSSHDRANYSHHRESWLPI